jgi:hypothetical protein
MDITSSYVAEDQRVIVLPGLVTRNPRIAAAQRIELVLSCIADPGGQAEEESLNGNDINCIDRGIAIHISSRQPASREGRSENEEMPLYGDHIHGVNASGAWRQGSLARCYSITPARRER